MSIVNATYFANYEDYNGFDEVACLVDTDTMEVVEFGTATSCRWYTDPNVMCVSETVQLATGEAFDAIKFDEYNDALAFGYADEYDRNSIILFDSDMLAVSMQPFAQ